MRTKKVTIDDQRLVFHRINSHGFMEELPLGEWVLDILSDITGDCRFDTLVDKRFPVRFRIANFVMRDELRWHFGSIQYHAHEILDLDPEWEDNEDNPMVNAYKNRLKLSEWHAKRVLKHVKELGL